MAGLVAVQAVLLRQAWQREAQTFQRNVLSTMALTLQQVNALEIAEDAIVIIQATDSDSLPLSASPGHAVTDIDTVVTVTKFSGRPEGAFPAQGQAAVADTVEFETRKMTISVFHDRNRFIQHVVHGLVDTEPQPIDERLAAIPLDSLLSAGLENAGIDAEPQVGVMELDNGVPVRLPAGADTTAFRASPFRTRLFDLDFTPPFHELVLVFSGEKSWVLRRIWGDDAYHAGRSMDVFVSRLRKHLAPDPSVEIRTIHGKGLKLIVGS